MKLYIAGGCSEHGRNSFLVTGDHISFLVDAGRMKEKPECPFPELSAAQIGEISYLFLTHSHTDHTGAIGFLEKHGFRGTVVGTAATLKHLPPFQADRLVLNEQSGPLEEFQIDPQLSLVWGRSGHCIGSVWYEFHMDGRTILFTGDYEEESIAYECDCIRGRQADLAVVDCAYGTEREDAARHWQLLNQRLDELTAERVPMLFPVPSHGRGFDVMKLLADRGVTTVMADSLMDEYLNSPNRSFWLRESFLNSEKSLRSEGIHAFEEAYVKELKEGGVFPARYMGAGILVRDSQLVKEENREIARGVSEMGGRTVLTGKQDPSSFARRLLVDGRADFFRISVHQNVEEMKRLLSRNAFRRAIPYHCRESLTFEEPEILVVKPRDTVEL